MSPRLHVLTFNKLLRRGHILAVHSHEIHAGGHVAEVDAGMVLSELYSLDRLAEGVIDDSFLYLNIAVDAQFDVVVGWVWHQADASGEVLMVNTHVQCGESYRWEGPCADHVFADSLHA